jgi:hypothetical protein
MKLRIKGNSLRFRLSDRDLARLLAGDPVKDQTPFPSGTALRLELVTSTDIGIIQVSFNGGLIRLTLPQASTFDWIRSPVEELRTAIDVDGAVLHVSVEKDLDRVE